MATDEPTNNESEIAKEVLELLKKKRVSQEEYNKLLKEQEEREERLINSRKDAEEREERYLAERIKKQEKLNKILEENNKLQEEYSSIVKEIASLRKKSQEGLTSAEEEDLLETLKKQRNALVAQREERKKMVSDAEKSMNETEEKLKKQKALLEKIGEQIDKNKDSMKDMEERQEDVFDILGDYAGKLPVVGDLLSKTFKVTNNMEKFGSFIGKIGLKTGGKIGEGMLKTSKFFLEGSEKFAKGSVAAVLAGVAFIGVIVKMGLEVNNLSKQLGAATGFGDQFNEEITRMAKQGNMAGIGFRESAEALKALTQGLSSFNPKSEKTNEYMGLTVARLEKLGVSAASSVKSMEHMQRSMGMTGEQAADATAQLARMGKEIGITGTKMIEDFNSASGRLAIYGKNNIKVFKELAAAAKASGIEMQTLLGITEKFDKFDSAAESAAKLNAVLGTQLSTLEMMQATDSERILMLKQQVQMSVGNFDSLDKYTKQYIAQAMGVKDVAEAQKLLNMSMAEYQQYEKGQKQQADIQKELSDATESLVPFMTQLKLAVTELFLAFSPVIMMIAKFISFITPLIAYVVKFVAVIAPTVVFLGALAVKFGAVGASIAGMLTPVGWAIAGIIAFVGALSQLWDIIHKPGSRSMAEGMFDKDLGPTFTRMGKDASGARGELSALSDEMSNVYDAAHPGGKAMDIQAAASIDTSAIASGLEKVKSVLMELSTVKIDGFLAMTTDGTNSSFIMGSEGMIKNISEGKLVVDVKMPEMKMPDISVKVYIGDRELRDIIRTEAKAVIGRAG